MCAISAKQTINIFLVDYFAQSFFALEIHTSHGLFFFSGAKCGLRACANERRLVGESRAGESFLHGRNWRQSIAGADRPFYARKRLVTCLIAGCSIAPLAESRREFP